MLELLRDAYATIRGYARRHRALYALVRLVKFGPFVGWRNERIRTRLIAEGREKGWRMLNLGSGGRYERQMVNLDVTPVTGPDVVGDGFALPFAAGAFDLVVCDYVIEHVPDPDRFLRALGTVLRPGGTAYLAVPFLQPGHGAPHDYTRWTRQGFQLFAERAGFDVCASDVHLGAAFTLFWVLKESLAATTGLGIPSFVAMLRYLWSWLLCPLLVLDLIVPPMFRCDALASGYYFVLAARHAPQPGGGPR